MASERPRRLAEIERIARQRSAANDAAHDAAHLERVVGNAVMLATAEAEAGRQTDRFVIEAAAWLHDIVAIPKGDGVPGEAARRSADEARVILGDLGVDPLTTEAVEHAVATHSFSGGVTPETPEARVVQDADRLDALGAIGIARLWVTGAALGGQLYHPGDPVGLGRDLDDRAWGLDHIERKLLRLPELMQTEAGRVEAVRRAEFVRAYRDELLREVGAMPPSQLEWRIARGEIDARLIEPGVPTPTVPDAAAALGVEPGQIIKSLLFTDADGGVVLVILSGASRVDRARLAAAVGFGKLKMAPAEVVLARTGYPAGGTPPVGHLEPLPVILDARVATLPVVFGGGGRVDALLEIRPDEIVRVTGALVADIAERTD